MPAASVISESEKRGKVFAAQDGRRGRKRSARTVCHEDGRVRRSRVARGNAGSDIGSFAFGADSRPIGVRSARGLRAAYDERGRGVRGSDSDFSGRIIDVREFLLMVVEIRDHRVPIGRFQLGNACRHARKCRIGGISRGKDSESPEKRDGGEDGLFEAEVSHSVDLIYFFNGNVGYAGTTDADHARIALEYGALNADRALRNSGNRPTVHSRGVHVGRRDIISSEIMEVPAYVHSELSPSRRRVQVPSGSRVHGNEQFRSRGFLRIREIPSASEIRPCSSGHRDVHYRPRLKIEHVSDHFAVHVEFRVRRGFSYADVSARNVQGSGERIELRNDIVPRRRREGGAGVRQGSPSGGSESYGGPGRGYDYAESGAHLRAFGEIAEKTVHERVVIAVASHRSTASLRSTDTNSNTSRCRLRLPTRRSTMRTNRGW